MRACARCGDEFEPSAKQGPSATYCKPCHSAKNREWREANPDKWREVVRRSKEKKRGAPFGICSQCRVSPVPPRCRTCDGCQRENKREAKRRQKRAKRQSPTECPRCAAPVLHSRVDLRFGCPACRTEKECRRCHEVKQLDDFNTHEGKGDRRTSYCKPCMADRSREWKAANPEKAQAAADLNKARRRMAEATGELVSRAVVFERDGGKCHICRKAVDPRDWHLDHLWPLSRGGSHTYSNVAVSHPTCNMRKYAKVQPTQLLIR